MLETQKKIGGKTQKNRKKEEKRDKANAVDSHSNKEIIITIVFYPPATLKMGQI